MRECASRGFCVSPNVPYGFRKEKVMDGIKERNKLIPYDPECTIVKRAFDEVLRGKGLMDIVRMLNREGILSARGNSWTKTSLYKILTNEAHTGTLVWSRCSKKGLAPIRVENAWPAIIDKKSFDKVQSILEARSPKKMHPRRVSSPYLFSKLAKCGYCGRSLMGQDAKSGQFNYYVCSSIVKKGAGSCPAKRLNRDKFENLVIDELKKKVLTRENLTELIELINEDLDKELANDQIRLESISDELQDTQRRLDRLYESLETGKLQLDDLAPRIKELRSRQAKLELLKIELQTKLSDRHIELASKKEVEALVADLHTILSEGELAEKKSFIHGFIEEITVTGQEVRLTYKMPTLEGPKCETESVLPIVHNGGEAGI